MIRRVILVLLRAAIWDALAEHRIRGNSDLWYQAGTVLGAWPAGSRPPTGSMIAHLLEVKAGVDHEAQ